MQEPVSNLYRQIKQFAVFTDGGGGSPLRFGQCRVFLDDELNGIAVCLACDGFQRLVVECHTAAVRLHNQAGIGIFGNGSDCCFRNLQFRRFGGICCFAACSRGGNCDLDDIRPVGNCLRDKLLRCFLRDRSYYLGDGLSLLVSARLVLRIVYRCLGRGHHIASGNSIALVILNGHHIAASGCRSRGCATAATTGCSAGAGAAGIAAGGLDLVDHQHGSFAADVLTVLIDGRYDIRTHSYGFAVVVQLAVSGVENVGVSPLGIRTCLDTVDGGLLISHHLGGIVGQFSIGETDVIADVLLILHVDSDVHIGAVLIVLLIVEIVGREGLATGLRHLRIRIHPRPASRQDYGGEFLPLNAVQTSRGGRSSGL